MASSIHRFITSAFASSPVKSLGAGHPIHETQGSMNEALKEKSAENSVAAERISHEVALELLPDEGMELVYARPEPGHRMMSDLPSFGG